MFDRLNLAILRADEALSTPEARRSRVRRLRTKAVILFVLFAGLGVLGYRRTESKLGWIIYMGLLLLILAGRMYYSTRRLAAMDDTLKP